MPVKWTLCLYAFVALFIRLLIYLFYMFVLYCRASKVTSFAQRRAFGVYLIQGHRYQEQHLSSGYADIPPAIQITKGKVGSAFTSMIENLK